MFAKSIVAGLSRLLCVMAVTGAFAVPAVQAQNATNTATLTPPAGVTIPTTNPSCRDTDSDTTTSVSLASNVCTATDSDPITAPQLRLTKTASTSPMVVGVAASYTLKVDNIGTAATTAAATVTDTIPTGLTIGTLPAGCTNPSGQTVSCTIQPGLAATNGTISFVIPVTPTAAAGTSITNTARVSGGGDATCPAEERCTGTVITPVAKPELELTKTATLVADQTTITYTFSVRNTGGVALNNVTVSDTKLTGLSCSPIATLAINATQSFTCTGHVYTVTTADFNAGSVVNTATATGTPTGGTTPVSDDSTVTTPLTQTPKLTSTKVVTSTGPYTVGSAITYSVTATNAGNVTLADVVVSDTKLSPSSTTCASLAPGAVCTLTGSYTVVQTDVDALAKLSSLAARACSHWTC